MTLTDEEIRVKVAELMGWKSEKLPFSRHASKISVAPSGLAWWHENVPGVHFSPPDYLNDPASALQLCDRMREEGWSVMITGAAPLYDWGVLFQRGLDVATASDPYLARAVTLCFLAAHSNEKQLK